MARANGKVILLGEHAVVYGVPAIAASIDRGAQASARSAEVAELRIGDRRAVVGDGTELARALAALLGALGAPALAFDVELALPPGAGLGASAALGVALARSALEKMGRTDELASVLAAAAAWEAIYHGNPSGIDAAAAAGTGCLWFEKGEPPKPIELARELTLAIGIAGPPASTKSMVDSVAALRERRRAVVDKAFEGIAALVKNARLCLMAGDLRGLGELMNYNQMLLSGLFVSTEGIERCVALAREAGALGAKL
ncbi:MAG TPA: mevalonate kinase, partial [Polyangiaceae bacterium]